MGAHEGNGWLRIKDPGYPSLCSGEPGAPGCSASVLMLELHLCLSVHGCYGFAFGGFDEFSDAGAADEQDEQCDERCAG